jgi:siderophore synthetase component
MELANVRPGMVPLLYMERYVDESTQTYSRFAAESEVSPAFRPRSGAPFFEAITVEVPRAWLSVFDAEPHPALRARYLADAHGLFVVHPETWASADVEHLDELSALPRGPSLRVAPTASTRTVAVLAADLPPHFLKLHCPRRISRFVRRLRRTNIQNSVLASRDLAEVRSDRFAYLPDVLGITYDGVTPGERSADAWGFLVRHARPRPELRDDSARTLVPYFALYAGDLTRPSDRPILAQMIEASRADPERFVVDEIMIPVVECWAAVARERGMLLESHAQNVLLEVDAELRPRRVVHRDFDCWIDPVVREHAGLATRFEHACLGRDTPYPREQHYSLVYDRFVGHELLDGLLALLVRSYGADAHRVRRRVREAFHRAFPEAADCFPGRTTFYYGDRLLPDNAFELVDQKRPPEWR